MALNFPRVIFLHQRDSFTRKITNISSMWLDLFHHLTHTFLLPCGTLVANMLYTSLIDSIVLSLNLNSPRNIFSNHLPILYILNFQVFDLCNFLEISQSQSIPNHLPNIVIDDLISIPNPKFPHSYRALE